MKRTLFGLATVVTLMFAAPVTARPSPLGTAFTYQGELKQGGTTANGTFHLRFQLWDALSGGSQVGSDVNVPAQSVTDGLFTTLLDFGSSAFNGDARWLQVQVVTNGGATVTSLVPRQPLTVAPYALQTRGIFVDNSGRVGIGLSAPPALLSVQAATANPTTNTAQFAAPNIGPWASHIHYGDKGDWYIRSAVSAGAVILQDTGGNVGIGTSLPGKKLTVAGSMEIGTNSGDYQHVRIGGGNSSGFLYGSFPHFGDGIHLGYNYYADSAGANQIVNPGGGTSRLSMVYGAAVIATAPVGSSQPVNQMIVTQDGNVGIGTMAPTTRLEVNGDIKGQHSFGVGVHGTTSGTFGSGSSCGVSGHALATSGGGVGVKGHSYSASGFDFYASGVGTDYGSSSSIRWKRNVEPIADPLGVLSELRGVYFNWDETHGGHHAIGMIAEEVGKVLPEIVAYEENGIDAIGMDYSKLTPLLVEAVKALRAEKDRQLSQRDLQIANQQREIKDLQSRLESLETILRQLHAAQSGGGR